MNRLPQRASTIRIFSSLPKLDAIFIIIQSLEVLIGNRRFIQIIVVNYFRVTQATTQNQAWNRYHSKFSRERAIGASPNIITVARSTRK
jgi:hypothetical protein